MRHVKSGIRFVAGVLAVLVLTSCARGQRTEQAVTFTDPFAYCAAIGTIDAPDAWYVGPKVPTVIAKGLRAVFGLPATAPLEPFQRATYWRCLGGKVFACAVGANLPCLEKANLSRTPTQGMVEFCTTHSNADNIPAYVTGRATVYLWRCREGKPEVVRQVAQPDARGYLANFWYEIKPVTDP